MPSRWVSHTRVRAARRLSLLQRAPHLVQVGHFPLGIVIHRLCRAYPLGFAESPALAIGDSDPALSYVSSWGIGQPGCRYPSTSDR
jgi:hypothetical protein